MLIKLLDSVEDRTYLYEVKEKEYFLKFPKVLEISAEFDYEKSSDKIDELLNICRLIQDNISSRKSREHIYKVYGGEVIHIYAGPDSVKTFRDNLFKRLAEVFFNLRWIYENQRTYFNLDEFKMYEKIFYDMKKHYKNFMYF